MEQINRSYSLGRRSVMELVTCTYLSGSGKWCGYPKDRLPLRGPTEIALANQRLDELGADFTFGEGGSHPRNTGGTTSRDPT